MMTEKIKIMKASDDAVQAVLLSIARATVNEAVAKAARIEAVRLHAKWNRDLLKK